MQLTRRIITADPRMFGRGPRRELVQPPAASPINSDVRLFITTFIAGFLFVSVLLA